METAAVKDKLDVVIVGGGMIARSQLLPSMYHLQRLGRIGSVKVCAQHGSTLKKLAEADNLQEGFPGHSFEPHPNYSSGDLDAAHPDLYREVLASQPPRQLAVIATPDHLHYPIIKAALESDQHVICVKPMALKHAHTVEIEQLARERGLLVGVEFHKRQDYRTLLARQKYQAGEFGEYRLGWARLFEPWKYRHSNFQNWFTCDNTDVFSYISCHYIDMVAFITGLRPVAVSVYGIRDTFPNGNEGFLWSSGRVIWENGACLTVSNALSYPDGGAGFNTQGMALFGRAEDRGTMIWHSGQDRGVKYAVVSGEKLYQEPNPDFILYLPWAGEGLMPVGYGYRSIEMMVSEALRVEAATEGLDETAALAKRQDVLAEINEKGLLATPANSGWHELVTEAGRLSILNGGREALIEYGQHPSVMLREY